MNSTSFTSVSSNGAGSADKMANIDCSSTAHLTLETAMNLPMRDSTNSDSDLERSPSVTVLTTGRANSHHHHHHSLTRPSQLCGFALTNRIHLTKHHRNLWSRATSFEKMLMLAVFVLGTTTILLLVALVSIFISQNYQNELKQNVTKTPDHHQPYRGQTFTDPKNRTYCLSPDCVKVAASVISAIDLTVDPCDDFYVSIAHLTPPEV
mgnify:CR=1 FL=1